MAFLKLLGVSLVLILGAPVDLLLRLLAAIAGKKAAGWVFGALLLGGGWWLYSWAVTAPSPKDSLTREQIGNLYTTLLGRVARGGPNHLHARRLFYYSEHFAKAAGANVDAVRAGALLHDATKERGVDDHKERFCQHGENGSEVAFTVLTGLGLSRDFSVNVSAAIREHMGPVGYSRPEGRDRFMSRFCSGIPYPGPRSPEARVLYDIDMLDLMTVDGVEKVVGMRQTNPEFGKETLKQSALTGEDSAWRSVVEADETLLTDAARECGTKLNAHSKAFLASIDWDDTQDLPAFKQAVLTWKQRSPLPDCLPRVPI